MTAYLESDALTKPTCVTPKTKYDGEEKTGRVTSTITHGELFVHPGGKKKERYRLRWSKDDKDRERALPVGTYKVTGYRHVAKAKDGVEWVWSTTSTGFAEIEVRADETTHFAVRGALHVRARAFEKKGKHRMGLVFQAEKRLGNTLYRAGKRITIRWQCLDAKSEVLSEGDMGYG